MPFSAKDATAVTVTYGERWSFLRQVLSAAKEEGTSRAVVVDNGSRQDITSLAQAEFGDFARVVRSEKNTGSAGGYRLGLETALALPETELIFLLDDDNKPAPGCLAELCRVLNSAGAPDATAVLGFRAQHPGVSIRPEAYQNFRLADIPRLLRRKIFGPVPPPQEPFAVDVAPYGGLLFHKTLCERYGLPDENFVIYSDDTELTWRVTRGGGKIIAVPRAEIEDLISDWNVRPRYTLRSRLEENDFRAFYGTRNKAYFETHCVKHNPFFRKINGAVYLSLLGFTALATKNLPRFRLLRSAMRQGEAGVLGESPEFRVNA